jgi:hypothetical protein
MADENTTATTAEPTTDGPDTATREEAPGTGTPGTASATAEPTEEGTAAATAAAPTGAGPEGGPVPGDPSTEPVATAGQSHVEGRVGPATIAEDPAASWHTPDDLEQVEPGTVTEDRAYFRGGPVPAALPDAVLAAQAIDSDDPAALAALGVSPSRSGGPVQVPPRSGAAGTTGPAQTTAAPGSSESPASPTETSASPDAGTPTATSVQPGSEEHTSSGSDDSGTSTTPAGTSDPAGSTSESGGSTSGATGSTTPSN